MPDDIADSLAQSDLYCGLPTRVPGARRRAELALLTRRRTQDELVGLGHRIAASTVRKNLTAASIDPHRSCPARLRQLLAAQAHAILAVDFAHVDTVFLRRLYILVVIEHLMGMHRCSG